MYQEDVFYFTKGGNYMEFKAIYKKFSIPITRLAKKSRSYSNFIDEKDIAQEMIIHLWEEWRSGRFKNKTDSYVLNNLWFYSQNYLRKKKEKVVLVSLYEPVGRKGTPLENIILDNSPSFIEVLENKIFIQKIKNNGLTKREEEVFSLRLEGYRLREIGERLGISHVRVFKIQESIRKKWI